jgi:hypothetical protein
LDLVNAVELYDRLSESFEEAHRAPQLLACEKGIPSFFSAFLPKSGGTYLHNRLVNAGAVEIFNHTSNPIDSLTYSYLIPGWLRVFLRGGASCHSHLLLSPWNIRIINDAGVRKIWVHLRDPRQAALSAYWHGQGLGQGSGEWAQARARMEAETKEIHERVIGGTYVYDKSFDEQLRFNFERFLKWIMLWMKSQEFLTCEVLFTTFEEMISDRGRFEYEVLNFHDATFLRGIFMSDIRPEDRFREGSLDEWRTSVGAATRDWMTGMMPPDLFRQFGWQQ